MKGEIDKKNFGIEWENLINKMAEVINIKIINVENTKWIEIDFKDDYEKAKRIYDKIVG